MLSWMGSSWMGDLLGKLLLEVMFVGPIGDILVKISPMPQRSDGDRRCRLSDVKPRYWLTVVIKDPLAIFSKRWGFPGVLVKFPIWLFQLAIPWFNWQKTWFSPFPPQLLCDENFVQAAVHLPGGCYTLVVVEASAFVYKSDKSFKDGIDSKTTLKLEYFVPLKHFQILYMDFLNIAYPCLLIVFVYF